MNLRDAIKQSIALRGLVILTDVKLMNILNDLHAFDSLSKAYRNVLTTILDDHLLEPIIVLSDLRQKDFKIKEVKNTLIQDYGFSIKITDFLLSEIALALDIKATTESVTSASNDIYIQKSISSNTLNCTLNTDYKITLEQNEYGNQWCLYNPKGEEIWNFSVDKFDEMLPLTEGYLLTQKNGLWGIINFYGDIALDLIHNDKNECLKHIPYLDPFDVRWFEDDKYLKDYNPIDEDNLCLFDITHHGVLDSRIGEVIVPRIFLNSVYFNRGLAPVTTDDKLYGYIDRTGKFVIPPIFQSAESFLFGPIVPVKFKSKYGYIDRYGRFVIPCKYNEASPFHNGLAYVKNKDNKYGFIDEKNHIIIPFEYDEIKTFFNSTNSLGIIAGVCKDKKCGYIDKDNNTTIDFRYEDVGVFNEGLAYVCLGNRYGYINEDGKTIIPAKYKGANSFSNGYAFVQNFRGKWGVIDKQGKMVLPFLYDEGDDFFESNDTIIASVKMNDSCFYIDPTGRIVKVIY